MLRFDSSRVFFTRKVQPEDCCSVIFRAARVLISLLMFKLRKHNASSYCYSATMIFLYNACRGYFNIQKFHKNTCTHIEYEEILHKS